METLFVAIEGDVSGLLDDVDEGVDKTKDKLEELDDAGQKSGKSIKGSAGIAGAAFGLAAGAAGILLNVIVSIGQAAISAFANLASGAVQANAQFETFAVQFETLLGSGSLAQERLEELAQFGVETPFELPEIVEASRTLQTFGGTVLATGDNLRMIGDIAAGVNQPFQDVAFWIGRMFDALQNGQPFGEASSRLQEMGAISGNARRQMEQMQKAGEDGAEIFGFFSEQVGGRFAGNMERLSGTFQGVTSNLEDFRGNLLRVGGEPFFEEVRQSALDFLDLLNENEGTITAIAVGIGELGASIVRFVREGLGGINFKPALEGIQSFLDWLNKTKNAVGAFLTILKTFAQAVAPIFTPIISVLKAVLAVGLSPIINAFQALRKGLARLDEALIAGAQILAFSAAGWKGLLATLAPIGEVVTKIGQALLALATGNFAKAGKLAGEAMAQMKEGLFDVDGGIKAMEDSIRQSADDIDKWINPVEEATEAAKDLDKAVSDAADTVEEKPLLDPGQIEKFGDQLAEAAENRAEQQAKLEEDTAEKIAQIVEDANDKRLAIDEKFNDDLAKLAADSEGKRLGVIEKTRQALAELEESTDRQLASRKAEFNKNELRQTEDHLKAMRRLQEDFLFNLDDAVRSRDAGAIVDLQRQFQRESSRREEDFSTGQNRQSQDFDQELDAIRENEASRREELLAAQAKSLGDIDKFEEEKRGDLEMRRQEEQQKLEEDLAEKLQRENDNFIERQAALDEALQKQLESVAKSLADQKDITEEGAREILETFDQFFGIGGDIDSLMEDFARKRKIRADILVTFSGETAPEPEAEAEPPPTSAPQPQPGKPRLGGPQQFATGGTLIANKPTLALFGEAGPEVVQFTPMNELSQPGQGEPGRMIVELRGSAPPGIGTAQTDQIAAVLLTALQDSGALS